MKKTIIALMALAGFASADTLTYDQYEEAGLLTGLQAAWDFDSATADVLKFTMNNSFAVTNGVGSVGSSNTPWANNIGNNFSTGAFTISFDLISYSADWSWRNVISLYSGGNNDTNLAITDDGSNLIVYNYGFGSSVTTSPLVATLGSLPSDGSGMNITLTCDGRNITTYVDGQKVSTYTLTWANSSTTSLDKGLTGLQINCGFGENNRVSKSQTLDNLAIWNTALTEKQVSMIATGVIPEPTTATLSLLALAGLAARRRRK